MSLVDYLGIHTPSGLPYLIAEEFLPENPSEDLYAWTTYNDAGYEEELLSTETCVVWSQCSQVTKVFTFEGDKQAQLQAYLTWFPREDGDINKWRQQSPSAVEHCDISVQPRPRLGHGQDASSRSRALVVLLKFQAHVFFLTGPNHVVNLPFEVERAFPAPLGLILQRKLSATAIVPPTPVLPAAPPNSFFSSQSQPQPFFHYPRRAGHDVHSKGKLGVSSAPLLSDWSNAAQSPASEELPRLFSFTDPLSEVGVIVTSPVESSLGFSISSRQSYRPRFRAVHASEEILYFSAVDEFPDLSEPLSYPFIIALTLNSPASRCTVWQATYADNSRQRESPRAPTGASTPLRRRSMRSSFGGPSGMQTPAPRTKGRMSTTSNLSRLSVDRVSIQDVLEEPMLEDSYLRETTTDLRGQTLQPISNSMQPGMIFTEIGRFSLHASGKYKVVTSLSGDDIQVHVVDALQAMYTTLKLNRSVDGHGSMMRMSEVVHHPEPTLDVAKVFDNGLARTLLLRKHLQGPLALYIMCRYASGDVPLSIPLPLIGTSTEPTMADSVNMGRSYSLRHPGTNGLADVVDGQGIHHRLQIQLRPKNEYTSEILEFCQCILQQCFSLHIDMTGLWLTAFQALHDVVDKCRLEWNALVVSLFVIALSALNIQRSETANAGTTLDAELTAGGNEFNAGQGQRATQRDGARFMDPTTNLRNKPGWSWLYTEQQVAQTYLNARPVGICTMKQLADMAHRILEFEPKPQVRNERFGSTPNLVPILLLTLHLFVEEQKLNLLSTESCRTRSESLVPTLAQLGHWLRWDDWSFEKTSRYILEEPSIGRLEFDNSQTSERNIPSQPFAPPSVALWMESVLESQFQTSFFDLGVAIKKGASSARAPSSTEIARAVSRYTPRTEALTKLWSSFTASDEHASVIVQCMAAHGINKAMIETFPERIATILRKYIGRCQADPPTDWDVSLLKLVYRDDLELLLNSHARPVESRSQSHPEVGTRPLHDMHTICSTATEVDAASRERSYRVKEPYATRLIFSKDQRLLEANKLLNPMLISVNVLKPVEEFSESERLQFEEDRAKDMVAIRTLALPSGHAALGFRGRMPMVTEKVVPPGFSMKCIMKPSNRTVTADRSLFTEDKVGWAFFHAGVGAGLKISASAVGIDTSWIAFNKPTELNNRHAGLLLGLGLNGHLKGLAKWLVYKYLTPKHTMTSIGLLLGLSASSMGTMDTLITRLLSVHVTRLLPPGAAELNLSPLTQTTGLMGIGLLYYNTQHRRMSEVMLSEVENNDMEDSDSSGITTTIRDECYRLAAGFALGFINLGKGNDLRGLHDMHLIERLLSVAVGSREVSKVHILDEATAGAVIAVACIFMKTHNKALARKIDVPDTVLQFDYVRPDILLLRTVAKHLIMWDHIEPSFDWIKRNLPQPYRREYRLMEMDPPLQSEDIPFYNIILGLCWVLSLRYAGTGSILVRNILLDYLDVFCSCSRDADITYDQRLTHATIIRGVDLLSIACATVMAGTGDLLVFRRLRWLHSRIVLEIKYGSWFATHLAMGILFMGGGLYTFNTSNLAIASLLCAFYPLFPTDVLDNKAHCQAFRHFWVFAAEPRALIVKDVDTLRAIKMPIAITFLDGTEKSLTAPCLLPPLDSIRTIGTTSKKYWSVTLDFASNPAHLDAFKRNQTLYVRRCPPSEAHKSVFAATAAVLDEAGREEREGRRAFEWLWGLEGLEERGVGREEVEGLLDGDEWVTANVDGRLAARAEEGAD